MAGLGADNRTMVNLNMAMSGLVGVGGGRHNEAPAVSGVAGLCAWRAAWRKQWR
jgi:hypothetical protein